MEGRKVISGAFYVPVQAKVAGLVRNPGEWSFRQCNIFCQIKIAFRNLQIIEYFQIQLLKQRERKHNCIIARRINQLYEGFLDGLTGGFIPQLSAFLTLISLLTSADYCDSI